MASKKHEYTLFDKNTQAIIYGRQVNAVQRMLDFDAICNRQRPSVVAIVDPEGGGFLKVFFGAKEILVPAYRTLSDATKKHPDADVMINFSSQRSAYRTTMEAMMEESIKTIVVIAEGVPERRAKELLAESKKRGKTIIGPATVGGLVAGQFKIGNTGGAISNIIQSKLYRSGTVGLVTKSGGMQNEMCNIIAKNTPGVYESIAIGGDRFPGTTLIDHIMRFEKNPAIKMIVVLGEVGGLEEYKIVEAKKDGLIKKPIVAWVTGTCAEMFKTEIQFGHASAKSGKAQESASAKNKALKDAGVVVPNSFNDFDKRIRETYERCVGKVEMEDETPPVIPENYADARALGKIRRPTNFICTISSDLGEEVTYSGVPLSEIVASENGIGDVISLLWFKRRLPKFVTDFFETVLVIVADHGPAVSGAHNAIVAARAGKDLVASLASGLLTIGPRFGGAIDEAARYFKKAADSNIPPKKFVDEMKQMGMRIPGIGHRVKSVQNPDKRVELLKNYARRNFKKLKYLDYALEVEKITTKKKNNLILNIDGCIAALFLDLLENCPEMTEEEKGQIVELGYLNAFFVLGRSIGIIGHILDQYRLNTGLYRHPTDDILYLERRPD